MSRPPLLSLLRPPPGDGVSDRDLARRYAETGDEAAFELLVRRHAGAVWAACRRTLPDHHAAEDAFQAAFLALARRSGTIRTPCVAGWLYRVAVRAALRARAAPAREPDERAAPAADPDRAEAAAVVQQEVARLEEKYRLPVVLCDLEGLTHAAAAACLGWPVGTVSGRLSVARDQLRDRLARRGLGVVALSAALAEAGPAPAAWVRAAVANAAGGTVPPAVTTLTDGVLHAMRWAKIKLTAAVAAVLVVAGASAVAVVGQDRQPSGPSPAAGVDPPAPAAPPAAAPPPAEDPVQKLRAERIATLEALVDVATRLYQHGRAPIDEALEARVLLLQAKLETAEKASDRVALYKQVVEALKGYEVLAKTVKEQGRGTDVAVLKVRARRLEVEIQLEQAKAKEAQGGK